MENAPNIPRVAEPSAGSMNSEVGAAAPPPKHDEHEVIDLTFSDSSDEDDEGGPQRGTDDDDNSFSDADSDMSEVEIHLNKETRTQLHTAIATVSEARLRQVLKKLVASEQAVEIALTRELVTVKRETKEVVPRWERCMNCETEYDINALQDDEEPECSFHPGELEVDEDGFDDWDESVHGPMDTESNRRQYPEHFKWSCCEENAFADGCVQGSHKPMEHSNKRKRYE